MKSWRLACRRLCILPCKERKWIAGIAGFAGFAGAVVWFGLVWFGLLDFLVVSCLLESTRIEKDFML